jgi:hypothetical protein
LLELESGGRTNGAVTDVAPQLSLFAATPPDDGLRRDLAALDVDAMTPLEAMTRLYELRERARHGGARQSGAREGGGSDR